MKFRAAPIFYVLILYLSITPLCNAQHIFPQKIDTCSVGSFCLDCGDEKGRYNGDLNAYFEEALQGRIREVEGMVYVQVLIDTLGSHCVKSISNQTGSDLYRLDLVNAINAMTGFVPAITNGKPQNVSITLQFELRNSKSNVTYKRFEFEKVQNLSSVGKVEILNTHAKYQPCEVDYLEIYSTKNSLIPWDMSRAIIVDSSNIAWLGTDNGIVRIKNGKLTVINSQNAPLVLNKVKRTSIISAGVDIYNNRWFTDGVRVYKNNRLGWEVFDSTNSPLHHITDIYTDAWGRVWFNDFEQLVLFENNQWSVIRTAPDGTAIRRFDHVFIDSKKRMWIGTYFDGNIMINEDSVTHFNVMECPLQQGIITGAAEQKDGTLWFAISGDVPEKKGLVKYSKTGEWTFYTIQNSALPSPVISDLVIDEKSGIMWLSIEKLGIARYDFTDFTILTPENSRVPSATILDIHLDNDGNLWCATFAGLLKIVVK